MNNRYSYDVIWDEHVKDYIFTSDAINYYKKEEPKRFYCPGCQEALVFVNAEIRRKHFRHNGNIHKEDKCSQQLSSLSLEHVKNYCNESNIHKNFKCLFENIMNGRKVLTIPAFEISLNDHNPFNKFEKKLRIDGKIDESHLEFKTAINKRNVLIEEVEIEKRQNILGDIKNLIIPDLVIKVVDIKTKEKLEYNIEIVVTNDIDNAKYNKIVSNKKNCLQINIEKVKKGKKDTCYYIKNFSDEARYIYTEEIDLLKEYEDFNLDYICKINILNHEFISEKDKCKLSFYKETISIKDNDESRCIFCNNTVYYNDKTEAFMHSKTEEFLQCLKKRDITLSYKNILYTLQEKNEINFLFNSLTVKINNNSSICLKNHYTGLYINQYSVDKDKLENHIYSNIEEKNIDLLDILHFQQINIAKNAIEFEKFLLSKEYKDKFLINENETCPSCGENQFNHNYDCYFKKDIRFFSENKDIVVNNFLEKLMAEKIISLKKAMMMNNFYVKNILKIVQSIIDIEEKDFCLEQINQDCFVLYFCFNDKKIDILKIKLQKLRPSINYSTGDIHLLIDYKISDSGEELFEVKSNLIKPDCVLLSKEFSKFIAVSLLLNCDFYRNQVRFLIDNKIINSNRDLQISSKGSEDFFITFDNLDIARFHIFQKKDYSDELNFKDFNIIYHLDLYKGQINAEYICSKESFYNKSYFLILKFGDVFPDIMKLIKKKDVFMLEERNRRDDGCIISYEIESVKHKVFIGDNDDIGLEYSVYIKMQDYLSKEILCWNDFVNHIKNIIRFPTYTQERINAEKQKIQAIKNMKKKKIYDYNLLKAKKNKIYFVDNKFSNILNIQKQLKLIYGCCIVSDVNISNDIYPNLKFTNYKKSSDIIIIKVTLNKKKILLLPYPLRKNINIFEQLIFLMSKAFQSKKAIEACGDYEYLMFYNSGSDNEHLNCNSFIMNETLVHITEIDTNKRNLKELIHFESLPSTLYEAFLINKLNTTDINDCVDIYKEFKKKYPSFKLTRENLVRDINSLKKFKKKI